MIDNKEQKNNVIDLIIIHSLILKNGEQFELSLYIKYELIVKKKKLYAPQIIHIFSISYFDF